MNPERIPEALLQILRWLLALGLAANGLAMLAAPITWYHAVPGVIYTGPLNLHFVRDIGAAYVGAATGLAWRAAQGRHAAPAALVGALFLLLHAGVHLGETLAGLCGWRQWLQDLPGVTLPALLATALAWPHRASRPTRASSSNPSTGAPTMIDWLIRRRLAAFEARWQYPLDYARQLLAGSRRAFWGYAKLAPLAQYREGLPPAAWHVAKIVALRSEDCGPCTQLAVDMARAEGVADALLQAAMADDHAALQRLDPDAALSHAFALAWARRDADLAERRDAVQRRFGDTGLGSLALAMSVSRMFPMIKAALGHDQACARVRIGGESVALTGSLAHKRRVHETAADPLPPPGHVGAISTIGP